MAKRWVFVPDPAGRALNLILDKSIAVERPVVQAYLARVRANRRGAPAAEVIGALDKHYRRTVIGIGAAAGSAAAVPGVGTGAALASGMAEVAAFVSATAMYVLALAEVHDIPTHDPEVRRALVMAVLVGEGSLAAIEGGGAAAAGTGQHWAHVISRTSSKDALPGINNRFAQFFGLRFGARQGALILGRAVPMGIGAGIGALGNAALARAVIVSARHAFGPPPARLPGRVIDGTVGGPGGQGPSR